jgi:predicted membrane protein
MTTETKINIKMLLFGVLVVLTLLSWDLGWAQQALLADVSNIVYGILFIFGVAHIALWFDNHILVRQLNNLMVFLGLIGTVVGFIIAFSNLSEGNFNDIDLIRGVGTALYTTLIGSLCYVWMKLNQILLGNKETS